MSPYRPARPCPGRGIRRSSCPNLIRGPEICCPDCIPYEKAKIRRYDQARDETPERKWLHSTRWRKASNAHKEEHPLCAECERHGKITPAYLIDHIIPHNGNYDLFWDQSNWQSLCVEHHESKHKDDRFGRNKNRRT